MGEKERIEIEILSIKPPKIRRFDRIRHSSQKNLKIDCLLIKHQKFKRKKRNLLYHHHLFG